MYSVVIPLHNEEGNIETLVDEIQEIFNKEIKQPYEIILVDDASTDQTPELLRSLKKKYTTLFALQHSKKSGQSRALKTGIEAAQYDFIITLDGDGQNNPIDIPTLIKAFDLKKQQGLVIGHRQKRQDTGWKKTASRWAFQFRQWILDDTAPDSGCGLKIFPKSLFMGMPFFNHIHRYFPSMAKRAGKPILSVPISHRARGTGQSKYGTWDRFWVGLVDIFGVLWLLNRFDPEVEIHDL